MAGARHGMCELTTRHAMCEMALSGLSQGSEEAMLLAHLVLTTVTKTCSRTSELQEESVVDHRRDEPYVVYIPVC